MVDVHVSQPLLSLLCVVHILLCTLSPLSLLLAPLSCSDPGKRLNCPERHRGSDLKIHPRSFFFCL